MRVKCPYCGKEYDVQCNGFSQTRHYNCSHCCNKYENSFAYHIQVELGEPLNKYWDWDKNEVNPYLIYKSSGKNKVLVRCVEKDYHGSYEVSCYTFANGNRCPYCINHKVHPRDSFAQWCIDNIDENFMGKYWSSKNTVDPFTIAPSANKKVWIKCQDKEYHNDYEMKCYVFIIGNRCPQCSHKGKSLHPLDSFGALYPDKAKYWSKNNKKSAYEVMPISGKKYKFICESCGNEFERTLSCLNRRDTGVKCLSCNSSKGEQRIKKWLDDNGFKLGIDYIRQKTFDNLLGVRKGMLSYDFYLPNYNLLIEYQGEYHDGTVNNQTKKQFEKQKEHDKRKKQYAKDNNIELLEIWYLGFHNIEKILDEKIKDE